MSFLTGLFGGRKTYMQSDNKGICHIKTAPSKSQNNERDPDRESIPYLRYRFEGETDAARGLMGIECIKLAEDIEDLICTEELTYGYFPTENGHYEAVLSGIKMSSRLFVDAKKSFIRNNGIKIGELKPVDKLGEVLEKSAKPESVIFFKEDERIRSGRTYVYMIYKGPDAASAVAFLEQNPVDSITLHLIVETPEGNYGRDIQGIYKE